MHLRHFRAAGLLACVIIAGGAGLAYHNSFKVPFVFDDESSILTNSTIRHLVPLGQVLKPPGQGTTVSGRPLLNLSFAVNYAVGRLDVFSYHVLNLVIHALAGMALFGILRRTLTASPPERPAEDSDSRNARIFTISLAGALIWTVHPLQTESVTYVAQRAESLMGLLYLLTLYCFIRVTGLGDTPPSLFRSRVWYVLAILACASGMATKEVMVTVPVIVLLFDCTFVAASLRQAWRERWAVYVGFACTWIELAYFVATTGSRGGTAGFGTAVKWSSYAVSQIEAVVQYLCLSVWPRSLVFDYGRALSAPAAQIVGGGIVLLGLLVATAIGLWRRTAIGFLGAWFFIILAPSSSIVPIATEVMAEHRMYLPLAAIVVLAVLVIYKILRKMSWIVFAGLVLVLSIATSRRNDTYRSALALWADTVEKNQGNQGAHNNLGKALLDSKNVPAAIQQFVEALRLDPNYLGAKSNLGAAFFRVGRFQDSIACLDEVLQKHPDYPEGHKILGFALAADGRPAEAIVQLELVLQSKPDDGVARRRLGAELLKVGRASEAIAEFEQVVRVSPDDGEAQSGLGDALLQAGRAEEAIPHYQKAVRLFPGLVNIQVNLGCAQVLAGHPFDAIPSFEGVLRVQPDNLKALQNLGIAFRSVGRFEDAQREFDRAYELSGTGR